jgi:putative transposase
MTNNSTKPDSLQPAADMAVDLFDNWFDPIETEVPARSRQFIEEPLRGELDAVLTRPRYDRDRGEPCSSAPPTPPCVRVRTRRFEKLR